MPDPRTGAANPIEVVERDHFIDALRVVAVLVVVTGHWLATSVIWTEEQLIGDSALSFIPESHYATWLLQVMPLLFFVGGFANARSLAHHNGVYLAYLRTRTLRLLRPTMVFVAFWMAVGLIAEALPLPQPNLLDRGADIAALPFWFVGVYVIVVALAPAMLRLHLRWGWRVLVVMALGALAIDLIVYPAGIEQVGFVNYAFVWLLPHQVGFFYADGSLRRVRRPALWLAGGAGLSGVVILTRMFDYPVSMIMVPGEDRWNTDPPSLALVGISMLLISIALLARPAGPDRGKAPRWIEVLNKVPLSMYLWHVSAITAAVAILYPLGFPQHEIGTLEWWRWRPIWLLALAFSLLILVVVVKRFEVHPAPAQPQPGWTAQDGLIAGFGVLMVAVALLGFGVSGFNRPLTNTGEGLLGLTMNPASSALHLSIGLATLTAAYRRRHSSAVAVIAALVLVWLAIAGWSEGLELLGSNGAMSVLNLVLGLVGLAVALIPSDKARLGAGYE